MANDRLSYKSKRVEITGQADDVLKFQKEQNSFRIKLIVVTAGVSIAVAVIKYLLARYG